MADLGTIKSPVHDHAGELLMSKSATVELIEPSNWLGGLQSRMHNNKAAVAFAAKIARVAWVILTHPGATYERRDPAYA